MLNIKRMQRKRDRFEKVKSKSTIPSNTTRKELFCWGTSKFCWIWK